jgi:CRP-like cAMP-binding protein
LPHHQNLLLASLPAADFQAIAPHLRLVNTRQGEVVAHARGKIERVYFPHGGILSYVVDLQSGEMIETGMIGKDGIMGAGPALDDKFALNRVLVQAPGPASVLEAEMFRRLASQSEAFRSLVVRHELLLHAQAQQSAACNAVHSVEERMCRWLLRMHDLVGDELPLTQEFLAQMLGVRRTSVSVTASTLQQAGFIRYSRGNVRILDVEKLQDSACECYETVRQQYELLLTGRQ